MRDFKKDSKKTPRKSARGFTRKSDRDDSYKPKGRFSGRSENNFSDRPQKRSYGSRGSSATMMHPAICSQCGERCEVPFKPNNQKPVYCNNCFDRSDNSEGKKVFTPKGNFDSSDTKRKLDQINMKLDQILEILDID